MDSQQYSDQPLSESDHKSRSHPPNKSGVEQAEISSNTSQKREPEKSTAGELAREFKTFEKLSLFINGILALIGIGALIVYNGQLTVMQGTLKEIQRSGQSATNQMWQAVGNINWLAANMQESAAAADSAAKTAKDALTSTVENARMDQRAWVAADRILSDPPRLKEGAVANVTVNFRNSGKSPALHLSVIGKVDPVGSGSALTFSYENGTNKRFGVLGPGGICSTSFAVAAMNPTIRAPEPLTGTLFQQLVSGDIVWYFHGVLRYRDVFGRSHWTTFCYYMHDLPGPTAFGGGRACEGHNDAGDGDNPQ